MSKKRCSLYINRGMEVAKRALHCVRLCCSELSCARFCVETEFYISLCAEE